MNFSLQRTSLAERTDEELVTRLQAGESAALDELYRRYSPLLVRYFYRMLWQDRPRAQDALHDVFMKIIEKPERVNAQQSFATWIYSVAHNLCKNQYRNQAVRKAAMNGHAVEAVEDAQGGHSMDHQSFHESLELVLRQEGEEARTIVVLRFEMEMSFAEIGQVLALPEGTVKSRLFYLKKHLAKVLEPYKTIIEK